MKSSTYYFHVKRKILADFQICISVPLTELTFGDEITTSEKFQIHI